MLSNVMVSKSRKDTRSLSFFVNSQLWMVPSANAMSPSARRLSSIETESSPAPVEFKIAGECAAHNISRTEEIGDEP